MSNKRRTTVWSVLVFLMVLWVIGSVSENLQNNPTVSTRAIQNTTMNGFIGGCDKSGSLTQGQCTCAYNSLSTYYGTKSWLVDNNGNPTVIDKAILANGYSQIQIDVIMPCMGGN